MFLVSLVEGFIPALVILGLYEFIKDPEHMEDYEKEFIETNKHENELDHHIKSGFNIEDTNFLIHICAEAQKLQENKILHPPSTEDKHIAFKKVTHLPYFVEMVRCHKKFAVIKAPEAQCAYLLKKGKSDPNIGDDIFYFHSKFLYYKRNLTPEEINERIRLYNKHCSIHHPKQIREEGESSKRNTADNEQQSNEDQSNEGDYDHFHCLAKLFATNGDKDLIAPDANDISDKRTESEKSLPESTLPEINHMKLLSDSEIVAVLAETTKGLLDHSKTSSILVSDSSTEDIRNHPLNSNDEEPKILKDSRAPGTEIPGERRTEFDRPVSVPESTLRGNDIKLQSNSERGKRKDSERSSTLISDSTQNHPAQKNEESKTFPGGSDVRDRDQGPSHRES